MVSIIPAIAPEISVDQNFLQNFVNHFVAYEDSPDSKVVKFAYIESSLLFHHYKVIIFCPFFDRKIPRYPVYRTFTPIMSINTPKFIGDSDGTFSMRMNTNSIRKLTAREAIALENKVFIEKTFDYRCPKDSKLTLKLKNIKQMYYANLMFIFGHSDGTSPIKSLLKELVARVVEISNFLYLDFSPDEKKSHSSPSPRLENLFDTILDVFKNIISRGQT